MKNTYLIFPVLLAASLSANASVINLTGTVRDFNQSHSDFERAIDGHVTGMVNSTLGADGKPVYSGLNTASVYNSDENFDDFKAYLKTGWLDVSCWLDNVGRIST